MRFIFSCVLFVLFMVVVIFSFVSISQVISRYGWVFCTSQEIGWEITSKVTNYLSIEMLNSSKLNTTLNNSVG